MEDLTLVEFRGERGGYRCGYCGSQSGKLSYGMPTHAMSVTDYQALIDRGWRRSGQYCYKPIMDRTCCPQYTIRCRALEYKLTKSKKKVLNKMRKFLSSDGEEEVLKWKSKNSGMNSTSAEIEESAVVDEEKTDINSNIATGVSFDECEAAACKTNVKPGLGADFSKPPSKKAKLVRRENKMAKLARRGAGEPVFHSRKAVAGTQSLQTLIPHLNPSLSLKKKLDIRTVRAKRGNGDFEATRKQSHAVYQKYQCAVHGDSLFECSESQWLRFLVECSLHRDTEGPGPGYGNFHQQYVLDGKIVAVGVIDVLPNSVSSVYFYYDPDYGFLSLGIYSALSEIAYVQRLNEESPMLQYYYMGFYIHNCQKMKYKERYPPSDLLCPETYQWVPSDLCLSALDKSKYSRLNVLNGGSPDDTDQCSGDDFDMDDLRVVFGQSLMNYDLYARLKYLTVEHDDEKTPEETENLEAKRKKTMENELVELKKYVSLVGSFCAKRIFLFRAGRRNHDF